jgi:NTE family protein
VIAVDLSWAKLGHYRARGQTVKANVPSMFNVFLTSLDIVEMRVARSRLAGDPADVMLTPLLPDFATMDYHRAAEAIAEGRAAVARMAPLLEQVLG